ncbi:MAG: hypothetical protein NTW28_20950 [Candidatus Solibacter sp.]|nr:hypothetical protein [Candidatus Solibacter sp.]
MKKSKGTIMRLIFAGITLVCATLGFADTITLKSGRVMNGTYLGGTARTVRIDDGVNVRTIDVSDILRIEFGNTFESSGRTSDRPSNQPTLRRADSSSSADTDQDRPVLRRPENVMRPTDPSPPPPAMAVSGTLPAGTNLVIRMIESVDSETNRVGQSFRASLDQPVMVDGETVIPRGADAVVKLVDAKDSGKLAGRAELTLSLQSVSINGRMVDINSQSINKEGASQGEKTAKVAGGTAAVGAIIGAIAGGGGGRRVAGGLRWPAGESSLRNPAYFYPR